MCKFRKGKNMNSQSQFTIYIYILYFFFTHKNDCNRTLTRECWESLHRKISHIAYYLKQEVVLGQIVSIKKWNWIAKLEIFVWFP